MNDARTRNRNERQTLMLERHDPFIDETTITQASRQSCSTTERDNIDSGPWNLSCLPSENVSASHRILTKRRRRSNLSARLALKYENVPNVCMHNSHFNRFAAYAPACNDGNAVKSTNWQSSARATFRHWQKN